MCTARCERLVAIVRDSSCDSLITSHRMKASWPPTRGRDVVVYKADNAVLIKQFVGWEGDTLVLRQLNPPDTLRVPRDQVRECHLVVGADQEG